MPAARSHPAGRTSRCLVPGLLLAGLLLAAPAVRAGESGAHGVVTAFHRALRSKDPKTRAQAFTLLRKLDGPAVAEQVVWGVRAVRADMDRITRDAKKIEARYEKLFTSVQDAQRDFDASQHTARDMDHYNRKVGKLGRDMDDAVLELKNLENDRARNRALVAEAVILTGEVLDHLEGEDFKKALAQLTEDWLHGKDPEDQLRWFDAVESVGRPEVTAALHGLMKDEKLPMDLRVRAVDALAARHDAVLLGDAIDMLKLPVGDGSPMVLAGIRALRMLHDRRGIAPLIAFLARVDLHRERDVAQQALVSLTGVDHGPYDTAWKSWWAQNAKTFVMPKDPKPPGSVKAPKKGKTFYGIHTFSDRILFIVDISGSMDQPEKPKGDKSKFDVLKQELLGTIFNLNTTDAFNVIFFNHQVLPWQTHPVEASERNKRLLKAWVEKQKPLGGTNIYDSLEAGFRMALGTGSKPVLDTIFFLTDGKPTAGRVRDPAHILDTMKQWNETAHLTIHTIGIGKDHDAKFLEALAALGDGTYMPR